MYLLRLLSLVLFLFWLTACTGTQTPPSTPTPLPTATAVPPTSTPTATPLPYEALPGAYLGTFYGQPVPSVGLYDEIGKAVAISASYIDFRTPFVAGTAASLARAGRIAFITWEYKGTPDPAYAERPLDLILEGEYDDHLQQWGERLAAFEKPIFLRWGHEMNGNWYPWAGANNGGGTLAGFGDAALPDGPERYVAAYRYIHDAISAAGADNVLWVWCPNAPFANMAGSYGSTAGGWNEAVNYYPGDDYVDWLCFDGYNWGTSSYGQTFDSTWTSFDEIFGSSYAELQAINPGKPIIIGEYASTEDGGDKAAWIIDAYETMQADYPQIRGVIWFHISKETDWRIDSSPESLAAFKTAVADDYWLDEWPGMTE
ncbi:MAG: hypothetical protein IAF02_12120 [Anaerolineae bacterium]|nr:hypothetical protein [Anaerolineae bacterium]